MLQCLETASGEDLSLSHTLKKNQHHLEHACTSAHTLALGAYLLLLCLSVSRFPRLSPPHPPTHSHTHTQKHTDTSAHLHTQTHKHLSRYLSSQCQRSPYSSVAFSFLSTVSPPHTATGIFAYVCTYMCEGVCVFGVCVMCECTEGGSVISLAGWNVGAWLAPVMISNSGRERGRKRAREREREGASGCSSNKRLEKTIC